MKILHVAPYFPPDRIGGVGEVVAHLHHGLLRAGHDSVVVTAGTSKGDPTVERLARSPLGWTLGVTFVAKRARDFDVVHCHHGEALSLAVAMRTLRVGTPLLVTYHVAFKEFAKAHLPYRIEGRRFGGGPGNWRYRTVTCGMHRVMDRAMLPFADATSFISRSSATDLLGETLGQDANVVYNAIPDEPSIESDESDLSRKGLLYVGNASDRKRVTLLPFVLRLVSERHPDAGLTVVGLERGDVPAVDRLFREFGVADKVTWVGRLRSEEITDYYRRAALVLVTSAAEGLPMVVLEAFRAGAPCVATNVSGHPEAVLHGENGLLVPRDDAEAMARACLEILGDSDRARQMGRVARRTVRERFSLDRQLN
jgi:glycosyltransferase involved in cell wall biosynthesis